MRQCIKCEETKAFDEFDQRKDGRAVNVCKVCRRAAIKQHYQDNKQYYVDKASKRNAVTRQSNRDWLIEYLRSHPCETCGNNDIEVLEFDHLDREDKTCEVSKLLTGSFERLQVEVEKCRVLCANCHRKWTRRQLGWFVDE